jgi:hypothetical protein
MVTASPAPTKGRAYLRSKLQLLPSLLRSLLRSSAPASSSRCHRSLPLSRRLSSTALALVSTPSASSHRHLHPWPPPASSSEPERPIGRAPASPCHAPVPGPQCTHRLPVHQPWTRSTTFFPLENKSGKSLISYQFAIKHLRLL